LLELELSWKEQKIGIVLDENEDYFRISLKVQDLGWQVFSVDELEFDLDQFLSCFL
jgi:hypothetical protein